MNFHILLILRIEKYSDLPKLMFSFSLVYFSISSA